MINEERTLKDFDHTSDMLTYGSHGRVWRICEVCGKEDEVSYQNYTLGRKKCVVCVNMLIRGPFNIEYFTAIQESINDNSINEFKTFKKFKYYSVDLLYGSSKKVWRICEKCGMEDEVVYQNYTSGQKICGSCATTGENHSNYGKHHSEEIKEKISTSNKGKIISEETRQKISESRQGKCVGKDHPNYNPNLTDEDRMDRRKTPKHTQWSLNIKIKDNFTCQQCGSIKKLVSHHILGHAAHPNSRFDLDNGITLCEECHKEFHHIYGYKHFTDKDFFTWINLKYILSEAANE